MRFPLLSLQTLSCLSFAIHWAQAASPPLPRFRVVDIDRQVEIGYGLAIADVDGDKKPDILLADKNLIVWYQNPNWTKHIIAEKLTQLDHVCIAAADLDGDGKAEVAAGAGWNPGDTVNSGSVHYLIPGNDRTKKWEPVQLPHEPTVHRMRWVKGANGKYHLLVVPLHGRGNKNGQGVGVKILAYKFPSDPKEEWMIRVIDQSMHLTHNFDVVQWDDQPGDEALIGGKEGVFLLQHNGEEIGRRPLVGNKPGETNFAGVGEVRLGKLPGGRRFLATVEPMHGNRVVTYAEPEDKSASALWIRTVIDETIVDGHAVACGDLTKRGYDQVVVGWRAMNKPETKVGIRLYIPEDKEGRKWETHVVDDNTMACEDLSLADLNGDGKLDIIAAGRATKNLKVYFNEM